MKSKTSCFKPIIFIENFKLFWPVFLIELAILLIFVPLKFEYHMVNRTSINLNSYGGSIDNFLTEVLVASPWWNIFVAVTSIVMAMLVFSYIVSSRNAFMMHAMPVDRRTLFMSNYFSGLLMVLLPQIITFLITVFAFLANGISHVENIFTWICIITVCSILEYSITVLAIMITGNFYTVPFLVALLNFFYVMVSSVISGLVYIFGFGLPYDMSTDWDKYDYFSPLYYFLFELRYSGLISDYRESYVNEVSLDGLEKLPYFLIASFVIAILSYLVYKKKKLETTGDIICFAWPRTLTKFVIGYMVSFVLVIEIYQLMFDIQIALNNFELILAGSIFAIISYIIIEMVMQKTVKLKLKINAKEVVIYLATFVAFFLIIIMMSVKTTDYVPKEKEIASVNARLSYMHYLENTDVKRIEKLTRLHRLIVSNREEINIVNQYNSNNYNTSDYRKVRLVYSLKDGSVIRRDYTIYKSDATEELIEKLDAFDNDVNDFHKYAAWQSKSDKYVFESSYVYGLYDEKDEWGGSSFEINKEAYNNLYYAIEKDLANGSLLKYNIGDEYSDKSCSINLSLEVKSGTLMSAYGVESEYDYRIINFGNDCDNIIKALIDNNIIEDATDLGLYN